MSSIISSATPTPTGRCGNLYDTPVRDAVCAMPYNDRNMGYMASCCGDAEIISYYDDCGLYCIAQDQQVQELSTCLYDEGAEWEDVFCRGNEAATATGDGEPLPSASARVVDDDERTNAGDDENEEDNNNDDDENREDGGESEGGGEGSGASTITLDGRLSVLGVAFGIMVCCGGILGL